jgi:hypothetical protein
MAKLKKLSSSRLKKILQKKLVLLYLIIVLKKTSKVDSLMDQQTLISFNLILLKQDFSLSNYLVTFRGKKMNQLQLKK